MGRKGLLIVVALIGLLVPALTWPADAAGLQLRSSLAVAPGVRFLSFVEPAPRNVVNVVEIAAGAPGAIRVVPASATGGRGTAPVAALCRRVGGLVCVNGDMFTASGPLGGELVDARWLKAATAGRQQLWVNAAGRLSAGAEPPAAVQSLGATTYNLLTPGAPIAIGEHDNFADGRYARTLVGWDAVGERFLVTVERGRGSAGMSLVQAAALMQQLGATTAVNEDGGGSTLMVVAGHRYAPVGEWARPVANVLAVVP